jgi:hypothetical protein
MRLCAILFPQGAQAEGLPDDSRGLSDWPRRNAAKAGAAPLAASCPASGPEDKPGRIAIAFGLVPRSARC